MKRPQALEPEEAPPVRNGVPVFPATGVSTREDAAPDVRLVNRLRDEEP